MESLGWYCCSHLRDPGYRESGTCLAKQMVNIIDCDPYQGAEDIDKFRPKLAAILYKSPLNKILNHTEDIDESVSKEI
ncbi:hypothetical protein E2562_002255 [Oryza meyeriana var. granulata]|uniref:Uncharacterized protein n=1 Tax=Oryza meyeriana var. granulata TaxID=110450 RepID=A0A6G1BHV7_9ORYZ|nr:hypothetical protein E2562_002255 [Oryza meyeriana var. granulata]